MDSVVRKSRTFQFGEDVAGFKITVLNEREIRAAAGIMFLIMFVAYMFVVFNRDFVLIKYVIVGFFIDFLIRVLISTQLSPTLILGRIIVSSQVPEYVGAAPKRFAWTIGLILSAMMFVLLVVLNAYSFITGVACLVCLAFLYMETAFGICIGCKIYRWFYKDELTICAGGSCLQPEKQDIQRISLQQAISLACFILLIGLIVLIFDQDFDVHPTNLWKVIVGRTSLAPSE